MILGIGTDIVKVARFKNKNPAFMARVITNVERAYLLKKCEESLPISAAGMFAAKEAVAKALGTGFMGFWPCDIEVVRNEHGKPYIVLHKKAAQIARQLSCGKRSFFGGYNINVSISHTDTDAVAFAIIHIESK